MDAAIDLSDAKKALDLANIRFQLMYLPHRRQPRSMLTLALYIADWKIQSPST